MDGELSLRDLLSRARAGDEGACTALVKEWGPLIQREVRVRLRDANIQHRVDSEDLCQSVFRVFFVNLVLGEWQIENPRQVLTTILKLARTRSANELGRQRAARRDVRRTESLGDAIPESIQSLDPASNAARRDWYDACMKRLSPDEFKILSLRMSDKSWEEIAAEFQGTPEGIRKRMTRARQRVLRELDHSDAEWDD